MNNSHQYHHTAHALHTACEKLPAFRDKKSPLAAAVIGFCFGFIGIGFYFRSWRDFLVCLIIFIPLAITGVGAPVGWCLAGLYGFLRAYTSNEKLGKLRRSPSFIQAEVVCHPVNRATNQPPPLLPIARPPIIASNLPVVVTKTVEARLQNLADFFSKRLITETEYQARRQQILNEI
jgi:hypothetical protein